MTISRNARAAWLATAAYIALSVAYTWPLAIRLTGVPHDPGDPLLTTWFLWWSSSQAIPLTAHWWNAPMFYPATGALGFSDHLLGLVPIALPVLALTHQPLVAHNVAFIATYALSALAAHFLAYTITRRHDVSVLAALAFAFAPYRIAQAPHIQVLASFWTPVCLAALHRYGATFRTRWAVLAAAAWVMQALCCGYYMFFLAVLVAFWMLWFGLGRWPLRPLAIVVAAFAGAAVVLAPFVLGYQHILRDTYHFTRSIGEIRFFSADVAALLYASEDLLAWSWLQVYPRPEANLFPGLTVVLLAAFAVYRAASQTPGPAGPRWLRLTRTVLAVLLVLLTVAAVVPMVMGSWRLTLGGIRIVSIARADKPMTLLLITALVWLALLPRMRAAIDRRSLLAFYLLAAFVMWIFALGPDPAILGRRALYRAPYAWLLQLPGVDGLRVPARFWMMTVACLSVVAALAADRLSGRARRIVVMLAVIGLLLDGWPRQFVVRAAPPLRPSPPGVVARLNLPIGDESDPLALYQQMFDPVPLYNGFSGYGPPHYHALRTMIESADPRILQVMTAAGPLGIVVDHAGDADGSLRRFALAIPGSRAEHVEADWSSYRIPRSATVPLVDERAGTPIPIASFAGSAGSKHPERAIDGNMTTTWEGGKQNSPAEATLELRAVSHVRQVVINLAGWVTDLPVHLSIDVSADGMTWEAAWSGGTALEAYYGAIRHPGEMPLVFPINRDGVRFIRLRQTGVGKFDWSIPEIQVLQ